MRERKQGKANIIPIIAFTLILLISYSLIEAKHLSPDNLLDIEKRIPILSQLGNHSGSDLYSKNAILISANENHQILLEKNSTETVYPASLTKIMTTIVAIERMNNLQRTIQLEPTIFHTLSEQGASMAGFSPNEQVSALDLLYGTMLPSGAEAAISLANEIAGSEQAFTEMMNQKAVELGMSNTHFTNVTGLHNAEHYTTVKDMAILLEHALKNDTFRAIFTSERHSTTPTNKHPNGITFNSTLFKNIDALAAANFGNFSILGGKTGYTEEAGLCLASLAQKNGQEYILITTGANGSHETSQYNIEDALTLYQEL